MNKTQLKKLLNRCIRLRPMARRFQGHDELPAIDDRWLVGQVDDNMGLQISLSRTGHCVRVPMDHIREFIAASEAESVGILKLKMQLHLSGDHAWFDVIDD